MRILRILAGVIAGYATMVLLITLVQEAWFGGVGWYESSPGELTVAGFFTFLSAVAGGLVGTFVAGGRTTVVARVMCLLVVTETVVLTLNGTFDGPLWFDLLASASLLVGIVVGSEVLRRRPARAGAAA
ncbi:MAG: hypothetical protein R3195_17225 [Gemmatimonadota bacterium]|nr:hypothetical protein [Gemmatimonadota bacterium]